MRGALRVMTFNIRYREADDGVHDWPRRRATALARIRGFDPDLLGVQECSAGPQTRYLRRHLGQWVFNGVPTRDPAWPIEMAPLFVKRRTFAVVDTGHFWLSETPAVPSRSWDAAFGRTATWAHLRHRPTGRSLMFLNTHLDYEQEAGTRSADLLQTWIEKAVRRCPVIVTGDFNANKRSSVYRRLTASGSVRDVFKETRIGRTNGGSFHAYGTVTPPQAIDWILVSRHFSVVSAAVDRYREGGQFASDHDPVIAVLTLN
jgi:endonuclease/exonuclease/phosphatase family metal-dependent hydrolase